MKNRIAAALSLTGVLVAGSAAALVNTQVLSSNSTNGGTALAIADPTTSTSLASTPAAGSVVAVDFAGQPVATAAPTETAPQSPAPTTPASVAAATALAAAGGTFTAAAAAAAEPSAATQATYRLGDAGSVTLDTAGEVLAVVTVSPSAGWTVIKIEQEEVHAVKIRFRSATTELTFRAHLLYGVVSTSVETRTISAPPVGTTPGVTTPTLPGNPSGEIDDDEIDGDEIDDDENDDDHDDDHGTEDGHETEDGDDD